MPMSNQEHTGVTPQPKAKRQDTRKRSPRACLSCRERKVRCDVAFVANACTNCVLDGKQCVVIRRRHHQQRNRNENTTYPETEALVQSQSATREDEDSATEECYSTPKFSETRSRQLSSHDTTQARSDITYLYYSFPCISNLSSLHPDDVSHLESQGCFRVPDRNRLDELLRAFFKYAHPILPAINEAEFWSAYDRPVAGDTTNRVPVVLISAMLFVACKYVDDHVIQAMYYTTANEAAERFRRKTKLLYDHETESSPLVLSQVSLLLANWTPQRVGGHGTQWLGRAIQHAQDALSEVKLWVFPKKRFGQSNLRRVWGCCVLSDRIHSLYTRRPLMIPHTPADTEGDHPPALSRADLSYEIGRSRVYGVEAKQEFIEAHEQMSDLCTTLGRVLALVYPQSSTVVCRRAPASIAEFSGCKKDLKAWYIHVTSLFPFSGRDTALGSRVGRHERRRSYDEPMELILSMMYLHYDSAMLALFQSAMMQPTTNPTPATSTYGIQEQSLLHGQTGDLSSCVLDITNRLSDCLQRQHLLKFPNSMIYCTALPLLLHLINTDTCPHSNSASPHGRSLSSDLGHARAQRSKYLDWASKITGCLRLRFRDEVDHILRTVKAVNENLHQESQNIEEEPYTTGRTAYVSRPGESSLRTTNWRELLNTRPKLYARLVEILDNSISWGGPLPENDPCLNCAGRHEPPGVAVHKHARQEMAELPLSPLLPSPSSQKTSIVRSSPDRTCDDDPVSRDVEVGWAKGASMPTIDLDGILDGALLQQKDSPDSYLNEAMGEIPSPMLSNSPFGTLAEDFVDNSTTVLDQIHVPDDAKDATNDFGNTPEFILEDQNADWMGPVLTEGMSLSDDAIC